MAQDEPAEVESISVLVWMDGARVREFGRGLIARQAPPLRGLDAWRFAPGLA